MARSSTSTKELLSASAVCISVPNDIALTTTSLCQPKNITLPKRVYSDKERSINPAWYVQVQWLEYSVMQDAAYCFPCRLFGSFAIGRSRPEKAFTVDGFRDWKHAAGSKGARQTHSNSQSHMQSVVAWQQLKATLQHGTVAEHLHNSRSMMIKRNRHLLRQFLTCYLPVADRTYFYMAIEK
uniref:TTF-type domain-containing protein n=1 Tax=Amphimedon queenslandica TaxID=400682 RepID=A0A1X7U290_AMPQE